ncbi:MAG TPA: PsbP-related protein [Chitinophagaceae bacterium]|nr:PsbP-related protein [Chitinophagaceae bacterium]
MRRYYAVLICLSISHASFSQEPVVNGWKSFVDTAGKFTAKYPATWVNKIKENNRVFFTSPAETEADNFLENINIHVSQNPVYGNELKIQDMYPSVIDQLKPSFTDFKLESQRFFKWNNTDACEIIYTGFNKIDESLKVRLIQWFCFYKTRLYTLTYTSSASNTIYRQPAKRIMSSVVFK